jgi:hypothetical protein
VAGFLRRAVGFYRSHGIRVERVMTDGCMSSRLDGRAPFCDGAVLGAGDRRAKAQAAGALRSAALLAA